MTSRRIAAAALAAFAVAHPASASRGADAARRGAEYIVSQQQSTGAYFWADGPADGVAEALASLAAAGTTGPSVDRALEYVRPRGPSRARERAAYAGRIIMGLVATGRDPRSFGDFDYVAQLDSFYDPISGAYEPANLYADALAVLGAIAARRPVTAEAVRFFRINECAGGGFDYQPGCAGGVEVDTTAVVACALAGADIPSGDPLLQRIRSRLRDIQNADGGFGERPGAPTNANSTGLALSALAALGEDPSEPPWRRGDRSPLTALLSLQASSGGFRYSTGGPVNPYATVQAIPGVAGMAYPVRPPAASGGAPESVARKGSAISMRPRAVGSSELPASSSAGVGVPSVEGERRDVAAREGERLERADATQNDSRTLPLAVASVGLVLAAALLCVQLLRVGRVAA